MGRQAFSRMGIYFVDAQGGITTIQKCADFSISTGNDTQGYWVDLSNNTGQLASWIALK